MKRLMMSAILATTLLTGLPSFIPSVAQAAAAQISFGIRIGAPPAPRLESRRPRQPGPDYLWVDGYWYPRANGRGYIWHSGYWTRAPFAGARWVSPRYDGNSYFEGYWEGDNNRRMDHDHHSDHDRNRDYRR